ncbi:MAG: FecR domain-containing protein [Rhodospirillales bacterium]|nr:FecR domain-containing protein [Rhodospirillales bacterium]
MKIVIPHWLASALFSLLLIAPAPASAATDDDVAGTIVRLQGSAVAMQDAVPRPLKEGAKVLRGDVISTGKASRLEMKMLDDAVMTLGERTVFVVIDYVPKGAQPFAAMRLLEGAFSAVSGEMMKTASAKFTVETETATIGIRGTTFWGGKLDGVFEVALLDGRQIVVENKAGRVVIDKVGDGTVCAAHAAPTPPAAWPAAKVDRAKATVAFR